MKILSRLKLVYCRIVLVICLIILQSQVLASNEPSKPPLKVGFIMVGPVTDMGWNYAQDQGRLYLESVLGKQVETTYVDNLPENGQVERIAEKMIANGCRLIFSTSYGYLEPILRSAARHPEVTFMQVGRRFNSTKNVGGCIDCLYEPLYISGVVAARMTKTNKLGFVAAHPVPPVLQIINAFTLGARSVNPKITVKVVWTNTWADSIIESESASGLIEAGADVLTFCQSNPLTIVRTAESKHTFVISMFGDVHRFAPREWLTGGVLKWGPLYTKIAQDVINHTWQSAQIDGNMSNGLIKLASFGPQVPATVRKEATELSNKIVSNNLIVFKGPITDREGNLRLAAGKNPDFNWLTNMNFFVSGVEGSLPKKQ